MKPIKVAISMLLIFCTFFCFNVSVFATGSTTDGEHGGGGTVFPDAGGGLTEYDGSIITYDYVKKNPKLFEKYKVTDFNIHPMYKVDSHERFADCPKSKYLSLNHRLGKEDFHEKNKECHVCDYSYSYIYAIGYFKPNSFTGFRYIYTQTPLVYHENRYIVFGKNSVNPTADESGLHYYTSMTFADGSYKDIQNSLSRGSDGIIGEKTGVLVTSISQNFSSDLSLIPVIYPINGKIDPIVDAGGNEIAGTGTGSGSTTDGDHGGGGTGFDTLDFSVSPDLSSKSFEQGEIADIKVTVTNKSKKDAFFAVNFSKFSASATSPRMVMDEKPIFNFREWSHMYDVNETEGRYQYRQAISISADSTKTVTIPISYLNLKDLSGEWIYMNLMERMGQMSTGLVSSQFVANKEYYFKLNFVPEYKPPQYGDGTPNGGNDDTYDKDGNVVKPSDDPKDDPFLNWINNATKKIVQVMKDIVDGFKDLATSASGFFDLIGGIFSFLPTTIWVILGVGLSIVILLRIAGR